MPGIVVEKRVVLLIGAFLASPAGAADKPVPFASPPPVVSASPPPVASIVPQSGFFLDSCLREHRQNESNIVIEARRDQAAAKRSTTRWMAVSAR